MRTIKFRVWNKERNRLEMLNQWGCNWRGGELSVGSKNAIMQFTGLHDRNGKEIYEGDILQGYQYQPEALFIVKFLADKFSCAFVASEPNKQGYINIWYEGLEVIGNIYENISSN